MGNWRRALAVSFLVQTLARMSFSGIYPFLPLYILALGVPVREAVLWGSLINFSSAVATAVAAPFWGLLTDRFGQRAMALRAIGCAALTTALLLVATRPWMVVAILVLDGLLTGVATPLQSLVAGVVPRARLAFGMGLMQASVLVAGAVGPLLGGIVNDRLGFRGTFVAAVALLLLAAALVALLLDGRAGHQPPAMPTDAAPPVPAPRLPPALLVLGAVLFLVNFASVVPGPVLALFVGGLRDVPRADGARLSRSSIPFITTQQARDGTISPHDPTGLWKSDVLSARPTIRARWIVAGEGAP